MMLFDRVKELADGQGKSLKTVALELGFGENSLYGWKTKNPGIDKLQAVADYFNVTTDYLLGRNQAPEWAEPKDILDLKQMLDDNVGLAYGGEDLTDEDKQRLNDILTGLYWEKLHNKKKSENRK
ncbi:helix-turn-helix domain-containing protein [Loigolactobacillus backii]|uniref:helix-turn-helix domain-containing protein n=1 Tax=Loigolactobacillus backii TaxID=375175 RepID=UPI0022FD65D5|nr:transcriptional regulator [Loigolactobacillus backii]MDA5386984.1 transcriptional regulator [Loigolactobacillus backii]MDA5389522.1 transcriptional regulator [Loigolactobacillus backii]